MYGRGRTILPVFYSDCQGKRTARQDFLSFGPTAAAKIIFAASPGRYGITPAISAAPKPRCSCLASQTVPNRYKTAVPRIMPHTCAARFSGNSSIKEPAIAARNKKPIRYPPVGPKSVPRPPEKSAENRHPHRPQKQIQPAGGRAPPRPPAHTP